MKPIMFLLYLLDMGVLDNRIISDLSKEYLDDLVGRFNELMEKNDSCFIKELEENALLVLSKFDGIGGVSVSPSLKGSKEKANGGLSTIQLMWREMIDEENNIQREENAI